MRHLALAVAAAIAAAGAALAAGEESATAYPAVKKAYDLAASTVTNLSSTAASAASGGVAKLAGMRGAVTDEIEDSAVHAAAPQVAVFGNERDPAQMGVAPPEAKIDISCDNATLSEIVTQFRRVTRANIICADSPNLTRRASVTLVNVPWLSALSSILNSRGFLVEQRDGIYYVKEDVFDVPVRMRSFLLNHADAEEIANNLNDMYAPRSADGKVVNPIAKCYKTANTLIITAAEPVLEDCEKIIRRIDTAAQQIYIEARFIEVSNQSLRKLGLQWDSLQQYNVALRNLYGGVEWNIGSANDFGTVLSTLTKSSNSNQSNTDSQSGGEEGGLKSITSTLSENNNETYNGISPSSLSGAPGAGRSAENMGWKKAAGFGGQLSADNFNLALSAFEKLSDAKVFSNPKIIVENGKEAKVDMTEKYPNVSVTSHRNSANGTESLDLSANLETIPGADELDFAGSIFFSWGITLQVLPRISPDGLISVKIVPTISQFVDWYEVGSGVSAGNGIVMPKYPIINMQRLITSFTLKDGTTAVIGGLSRTEEEEVDSGIPYLRKLPFIGQWLFGWKSRQKVQKEILVFVTVGIANPSAVPKDMGLPKNAVIGREYVEGRLLEPGDRPDAARSSIKLDLRLLDERTGTVEEKAAAEPKPVKEEGPVAEEKPVAEEQPVAEPKPVEVRGPVVQESLLQDLKSETEDQANKANETAKAAEERKVEQ